MWQGFVEKENILWLSSIFYCSLLASWSVDTIIIQGITELFCAFFHGSCLSWRPDVEDFSNSFSWYLHEKSGCSITPHRACLEKVFPLQPEDKTNSSIWPCNISGNKNNCCVLLINVWGQGSTSSTLLDFSFSLFLQGDLIIYISLCYHCYPGIWFEK